MNQEISKTTVVAIIGGVLVLVIGGGLWMWLRPAGAAAGNAPAPGTPQAAAAMHQRGNSMRDSFIAAHRRGPNGERPADPSGAQ